MMDNLVWNVFGSSHSEISSGFIEEELKRFFLPFPNEIWEEKGEMAINFRMDNNRRIELQFGYYGVGQVAISIECFDKNGGGWRYSACNEECAVEKNFTREMKLCSL